MSFSHKFIDFTTWRLFSVSLRKTSLPIYQVTGSLFLFDFIASPSLLPVIYTLLCILLTIFRVDCFCFTSLLTTCLAEGVHFLARWLWNKVYAGQQNKWLHNLISLGIDWNDQTIGSLICRGCDSGISPRFWSLSATLNLNAWLDHQLDTVSEKKFNKWLNLDFKLCFAHL